VVRRLEGRTVYLAETAVAVFDAERERKSNEQAWEVARRRWLALAASVHAPDARRAKIRAAPISAGAVQSALALYMTSAEHTAKVARQEKRWTDVAKIRSDQAAALYAEAGSPLPPPDEAVALYREGKSAILRSIAEHGRHAELVSAGCCRACRADDGKVFRISTELRTPRLPHAECPKGLCTCDWWFAIAVGKPVRRRTATSPAAGPATDGAASEPAAGDEFAEQPIEAGVTDDLGAEPHEAAVSDDLGAEPDEAAAADEPAGGDGRSDEPVDAAVAGDAAAASDVAGTDESTSEVDATSAGEGGGNGATPSTPQPVSRRRR
jgi:hypothetical protein